MSILSNFAFELEKLAAAGVTQVAVDSSAHRSGKANIGGGVRVIRDPVAGTPLSDFQRPGSPNAEVDRATGGSPSTSWISNLPNMTYNRGVTNPGRRQWSGFRPIDTWESRKREASMLEYKG